MNTRTVLCVVAVALTVLMVGYLESVRGEQFEVIGPDGARVCYEASVVACPVPVLPKVRIGLGTDNCWELDLQAKVFTPIACDLAGAARADPASMGALEPEPQWKLGR